jgi:hypothetical protein
MTSAPCGPDPSDHVSSITAYTEAGFDQVYTQQAGGSAQGFFEFYAGQVLPRLHGG